MTLATVTDLATAALPDRATRLPIRTLVDESDDRVQSELRRGEALDLTPVLAP